MDMDLPFQQSSGKFRSIPSLNLPCVLPPASPVKYSLALHRSKSQQGTGMRLPRALISSALFSPASSLCKPRDSRGVTVCEVGSDCCQKGIGWILRGGRQVCDYTMAACSAEGSLHNSQCNLIAWEHRQIAQHCWNIAAPPAALKQMTEMSWNKVRWSVNGPEYKSETPCNFDGNFIWI